MKDFVLDGEIADAICRNSLKQHIGYITKNIKKLKKEKLLHDYQKLELGSDIYMLEAFKLVHDYFGGKE